MTRERIATLLAVVAVLAVVGTTATAVAAYLRRGPAVGGRHGSGPARAFDHGQLVAGEHAVFEVPARAHGWTTESRSTVVYYVDRSGTPAVGVRGPAVFRDGYCRPRPDGSSRGFVGFTRPAPGSGARRSDADLGRAWVRAIALDAHLGTSGPHTPLRTDEITLADGSPAVRTTSRIDAPAPGPCGAPEVRFTMVSLDTGAGVAHLVLVRDAGVRGAMSDALAARILGTLRPAAH